MAPGVIAGAQGGACIAHRLASKLLMALFCTFLAISAAKSLWSLLA